MRGAEKAVKEPPPEAVERGFKQAEKRIFCGVLKRLFFKTDTRVRFEKRDSVTKKEPF